MDDNLFVHIISSLIVSQNPSLIPIEDKQECSLEKYCCKTNRLSSCDQCSHLNSSRKFQLKSLNLSGCYRFTDFGLK